MVPASLHILSVIALVLGFACFLAIGVDEVAHPQHMWIMNVVWPVVALFGTGLTLWLYFRYGRLASAEAMRAAKAAHKKPPNKRETPFPIMVANGTNHCGSGCMIGDICAEWLAFAFPAIAVGLGWQSLFAEKMFAVWVLDFLFAFVLGIAFQYFTIAPMRGLGLVDGLREALKADTLSLTAWQVGMYGAMAALQLWVFPVFFGTRAEVDSFEFWFAMQIAMICGFATSYPVNWWLIAAGLKETM